MRSTMDDLEETRSQADAWLGSDRAAHPERSDDGLHYGRAWHRYRYCHRQAEPLRVLDAGCGTGHSTLWAARLNPGARVLGADVSTAALDVARDRARAVGLDDSITFRAHDLTAPPPDDWGRFDFVVCRGVLERATDPSRVLASLAKALAPDGLLLMTLPSHAGRRVARDLRQAVDALSQPGAGADERLALARDLYQALRPDHPVRALRHYLPQTATSVDVERLLAGFLDDRRDWTLDDAAEMLDHAGLTFLYAATPWRWDLDRVFAAEGLLDPLKAVIDRLAPNRLSRLIDALDPALFDDEFPLYACPASYTPPTPTWPLTRLDDPATFDRLVPELTGLARIESGASWSSPSGRIAYQTITGVRGELDRMPSLLLSAVDGSTPCGAIEEKFASRTRAGDDLKTRQGRWIDLADTGLILLRTPTRT